MAFVFTPIYDYVIIIIILIPETQITEQVE